MTTCVFVHKYMRPYATSVCGLKLLVYEAVNCEGLMQYLCISACGLMLLVSAAL
jgi:hypothetical protein